MTQTTTVDVLTPADEPKKLSDMLNVLTILTFVGCGIGLLSSVYSFCTAASSYEKMLQVQDKLDQMPDFAKKMMGPDMLELMRKTMENRVPILLVALVGYALCTWGAMQMRKFKKTGFGIYVVGELLPIVVTMLLIGMGAFQGFSMALALGFPLVFIILYATQLKHLS